MIRNIIAAICKPKPIPDPLPAVTPRLARLSPEAIARQAAKANPRNARNAAAAAKLLTILNRGN